MLGPGRVKVNYAGGKVVICGRVVNIYGADNEAAVAKIQGITLQGAYVDEAATLPESFFSMLYSRLSEEGAKLWLTTNPASPSHWLKTEWLDKAELWIDGAGDFHYNHDREGTKELHRYTFLIDDNKSLPAAFVERQKRSYGGLFYRRYILAEWVAAEGAIYEHWDPSVNVVRWEDLPRMRRILSVGADFGSTHATTAVMLALGEDGRLYAIDEWRQDTVDKAQAPTMNRMAMSIQRWLAQPHLPAQDLTYEWMFTDPSAPAFRIELTSIGVKNVVNADNEVLYGIQNISALLESGNLIVSDRCKGLIREFPGYAWDRKATLRGEDKPIKEADDSLDALRYAIVSTETNWRAHLRRTQLAAA